MNYYSFHIGDYAAHTRRLSLLEDLAYRRLLDEYYLQEEPLTGEADLIARQIGMAEYVEEVDYVLTCFFESTPYGYINKRCDEEIAKYHSKHEQAIKAGRASAEKRLNKRSTSVQLTNNQEPITNNQLNITPKGFDLFWSAYGKKKGKPNALKQWIKLKLNNDNEINLIINKAKQQAIAIPDPKFRKDPERWLRDHHWEDEFLPSVEEEKSKELPLGTDQQIAHAYVVECGGDPTQSRFNSYFDMRKYILDQRDKRKII